MKKFMAAIAAMNKMYKLPLTKIPTDFPNEPMLNRLAKFKKTLADEVDEIDEIAGLVQSEADPVDVITAKADILGDVVVFCFSEAAKYGIPLDKVLEIIMESNASKLGSDGEPIYNEDGKFLKGPNYWKPEPRIRELLEVLRQEEQAVSEVTTCCAMPNGSMALLQFTTKTNT